MQCKNIHPFPYQQVEENRLVKIHVDVGSFLGAVYGGGRTDARTHGRTSGVTVMHVLFNERMKGGRGGGWSDGGSRPPTPPSPHPAVSAVPAVAVLSPEKPR